MGKTRRVRSGRGVLTALLLLAASSLFLTNPAWAVGPTWLRHIFASRMSQKESGPPVARYVMDAGGDFVFDRTATHPLLKFEDSPEVWALTVTRGPRGDLIYWNDLGQPLLRITKFGGVTVFTPKRPDGSAAAVAAAAAPLRLASVGPIGLYQHLALASARSGRAAQHSIAFTAIDADATSDGLMADAAIVVSEAMVDLAVRPKGRALLKHIGRVAIIRGAESAAAFRDGVIVITIAPTEGVYGRPSSLRIEQALKAR